MMAKSIKLALLLILTMLPFSAIAADYYVDITNKTGFIIHYIYVSPDSSDDWEEDVLGTEVLMNDTTRRITLKGYNSPIFDIKLVDEDGDSCTFWDIDVSKLDITATLADLD